MTKEQRNEAQRLRRASPEAKAKEARARRRSYWKKKDGYGHGGGYCPECEQLKAQHDL